MKKILLTAVAIGTISASMFAQSRVEMRKELTKVAHSMKYDKELQKGAPELPVLPYASTNVITAPKPKVSGRADKEFIVGDSKYDLQTNGCISSRLVNDNGQLYAAWTRSGEDTPYNDRGTGFNTGKGATWGASPTARVESIRTGFTNIHVTKDGDVVAITHKARTGGNDVNISTRKKGSTKWVDATLPTSTPNGVLWAHTACDGNTIHVVALSVPTGSFGGTAIDGMNGKPLYFRSKDGGATWDIKDKSLPGLDTTLYKAVDGDAYTIDASNGKVAIGIFEQFADCTAWISKDGGDNFTKSTINKFPLKDDEFTKIAVDSTKITKYPDAPNGQAIQSCDVSGGTMIIDKAGKVHAFYGQMFFSDSDLTDQSFNWYPNTAGVMHWVEGQTTPQNQELGGLVDQNGNGTFDGTVAAGTNYYYTRGLNSFTSAAIGDNGEIIVAYSGLSEYQNSSDDRYYRHVMMCKSSDGGKTWGNPFDLITKETSIEPDLFVNYETVFPSLARRADTKAHVIYQLDYTAGCYVSNSATTTYQADISDNFITYQAVPLNSILAGTTENVVSSVDLGLTVSPNPTNDNLSIAYKASGNAASVQIFDMVGRVVANYNLETAIAETTQTISVSSLTPGVYILKIKEGNNVSSTKFVKQ